MADTKAIAWLGAVPVWSPSHPSDDLPLVMKRQNSSHGLIQMKYNWGSRVLIPVGRGATEGLGVGGNSDHSGEAGIGRMSQDRVDNLSEKRKMGYLEWKRDIMRRVLKVEKGDESGHGGEGKAELSVR
ncbi:hypothetical protein L211DRAFT_403359 [Terfezia boudieri ATCC MYA-4762]|uniref:Uncharacterized protein n=1 Tax=Terfezia boudieri ATCC MYA-4762 TaxID=1051890 RepID=A0A3N4M0I7_9PEZI|nr:hypothetical protein L211DRAFT_403359 [Terfezia boudieri ATCC MYA-4762]